MVYFLFACTVSFILVCGSSNYQTQASGWASAIGFLVYLAVMILGTAFVGPIAGPMLGFGSFLLVRLIFWIIISIVATIIDWCKPVVDKNTKKDV